MNADDLKAQWAGDTRMGKPYITERYKELDFLWKLYHAKHYDILPHAFHTETDTQGNYIPLRQRRPSIRYKLPRIVVKKTASMTFSGRNWPQVSSDDQDFSDWMDDFFDHFNLSTFSTKVFTWGSIGTVVPMFRLDKENKAITLDVWNARDCDPLFKSSGDLEQVTLKYLATTANLRSIGIEVGSSEPLNKKWWFRRRLTTMQDLVFVPTEEGDWEDSDGNLRVLDYKSYDHNFQFVPALWVRNLPSEVDDTIDGESTFGCIGDFVLEIDYQLSQCGRGLKYNADPEVVISEPLGRNDGGGPNVRTTSKLLEVTKEGDAKLLEMTGRGSAIQIEFVEKMRNFALEVLRGSRKDPQRALSHAQSGKLAELLEDDLIALATELRTSYSKGYLLPFTVRILAALQQNNMGGEMVQNLSPDQATSIKLAWGPWFPPTSTDHQQLQDALIKAVTACHMDVASARRITYHHFGMVAPKNVSFEENLELIQAIERSKNFWQLEREVVKAAGEIDEERSESEQASSNGAGAVDKEAEKKAAAEKKRKALEDLEIKPVEERLSVPEVESGAGGVGGGENELYNVHDGSGVNYAG